MRSKKMKGEIEDRVLTDLLADEMYQVRHHKAIVKRVIDNKAYFVSYNDITAMYEVRTYD